MINEVKNELAYVLAKMYMRIPWSKIKTKSAHKFFMDRIKASSGSEDFNQFIETLRLKLDCGFIRIPTKTNSFLIENNTEVMNILRKNTLFITNYALDIVDELKENKEDD
jgi:hypothetical protein